MGMKKIIDGAYLVALGAANTVLLDAGPSWRSWMQGFPARHRLFSTRSGSSVATRATCGT